MEAGNLVVLGVDCLRDLSGSPGVDKLSRGDVLMLVALKCGRAEVQNQTGRGWVDADGLQKV